jgi:hypothetical protein
MTEENYNWNPFDSANDMWGTGSNPVTTAPVSWETYTPETTFNPVTDWNKYNSGANLNDYDFSQTPEA